MKKKLLFIPLVFLLCACSYDKYEMPKDAFINTNEKEYKVYSKDGKTLVAYPYAKKDEEFILPEIVDKTLGG